MFMNKYTYKVYYAVLPANSICNTVAPGYRHIIGGWEPAAVAKREVGSKAYRDNLNKKNGFYDKLLESVKDKGVVNPISLTAGRCPKIYSKYLWQEMMDDPNKILCCDRKGGSRLWAAQQLDIDLPCIISDFCGMFEGSEYQELFSEAEIAAKYVDKPSMFAINDTGVNVGVIPHIHLDNPAEDC